MKNISIFLIALLAFFSPIAAKKEESGRPLVVLSDLNFASVRGPVTTSSVSDAIEQLMTLEANEVYLYLDTPGGSVIDGNHLIATLEAMGERGQSVTCLADTAISMGYAILQGCPTRLVRDSSILMQHQMSFGTRGPIEQVNNYVDFVNQMEDQTNRKQASRLNMTVDQFKEKTVNDWWTFGQTAVDTNQADGMVHLLCTHELMKETYTLVIETWWGPVNVVLNRCPLMNKPVKISFGWDTDQEQEAMVKSWFDVSSLVGDYHEPLVGPNEKPWL